MVALLDGADREHASPTSRTIASLVELGYRSELLVVLVVVVVAQQARAQLLGHDLDQRRAMPPSMCRGSASLVC